MNMSNNLSEMSPEEAKASLGIASNLMSQLLPQAPEGSEDLNMASDEAQQQQPQEDVQKEIEDVKMQFNDELESLKKEVSGMIKDEIGGLKKEIQDALKNEPEE